VLFFGLFFRCLPPGNFSADALDRLPWIFIHGTDIVDRGLIVLFFGLFFVASSSWKFFCRRPYMPTIVWCSYLRSFTRDKGATKLKVQLQEKFHWWNATIVQYLKDFNWHWNQWRNHRGRVKIRTPLLSRFLVPFLFKP